MEEVWEVYALRYATHQARRRASNFIMDDDHAAPGPIDFFVWLLRRGDRVIVVDTGFDAAEARRRGRSVIEEPARVLADFGVDPERVPTVIVTHLHFDHAGTLDRFPAARFHLQAAEMEYATGPCMCHAALRHPFTGDHVCQMVRHLYSGRVVFHDGDGMVAPGVEVVALGGHSRGLQAVRVRTAAGWLLLASDASHLYENLLARKPFPIVVDLEAMLAGFSRMEALVDDLRLIVPGHDPAVCDIFPRVAGDAGGAAVYRLDAGPTRDPAEVLGDLWRQADGRHR